MNMKFKLYYFKDNRDDIMLITTILKYKINSMLLIGMILFFRLNRKKITFLFPDNILLHPEHFHHLDIFHCHL